jgi:hypothetical protein
LKSAGFELGLPYDACSSDGAAGKANYHNDSILRAGGGNAMASITEVINV